MRHSFALIGFLLLASGLPARAADIRECTPCSGVAESIATALRESKREHWSLTVRFRDLLDERQDISLLLHQRQGEPASEVLDGFDSRWTIGLHFEISVR